MARRKQIEGQLSIFDIDDIDLVGNEDEIDDERSIRRDDGAALQSWTGTVDGRVGEQSPGVAGADGGDAVWVDPDPGVRPVVSPDRDENVSGRSDGASTVPRRNESVSDVSGSDGDGWTGTDGTGSTSSGGGSGPATVADATTVAGGQEVGAANRDGLSVDDRPGYGTDTGNDELARTSQSEDDGVRSQQRLEGVATDWTGETSRPSGFQSRLDANLAALETLHALDEGNTYATSDQQQVLAGWSSWGALPEVFDPSSERVSDAKRERVRELLGENGWQQAKATTLNAHYTDPSHTKAIWSALRHAGFEGGPVLEPGSGSGEFIGQAPDNAQMVGVELDQTTARISSWLYPSAQIQAHGFEKTRLSENSFNAVVGNVPFGNFSVPDQTFNAQHHSIHNYFIAKSLRHTAPGGYVAVMTSTWTMDSQRTTARREFARYADLVGGVRLPTGSMRTSAGTDVMTDVLVFRRRKQDEELNQDQINSWVEPGTISVMNTDGVEHSIGISQYFATHPEQMIGVVRGVTDQWGNMAYSLDTDDLSVVGDQLQQRLVSSLDQAQLQGLGYAPDPLKSAEVVAGLHYEVPPEAVVGHIRYDSEQRQFVQYNPALEWEPVKVARNRVAESQALLHLRDLGVATIEAQSSGQGVEAADQARESLVVAWQEYVAQYGPVNRYREVWRSPSARQQQQLVSMAEQEWRATLPDDGDVGRSEVEVPEHLLAEWQEDAAKQEFVRRDQPHLTFLSGEPKLGLLRAMEAFDEQTQTAEPGALMTQNVVEYRPRPEHADSVVDAIAISLDETRQIDLDRVGELLNMDEVAVRQAVLEHAFVDPESGELVSAVSYLSGDVRTKLEIAEEASAADEQFVHNVRQLETVVPDDISIEDVIVNPGVQWVPQYMYNEFVRDTFEVSSAVKWNPGAEQWEVESPKGGFSEHVRFQWGTSQRTPAALLASAMNYRSVVVRQKDSDGTYRKDQKATTAAREKVEAIRQHFNHWVTEDPDRAQQLEQIYNRKFNSRVAPDYSDIGTGLELPGLAESRVPYSYQRAAVARVVNEPAVLLNHVVGAGKTGTMVMSAMELKRTGIAHKPVMVVPNHLVEQINREYVEWYPDANVLAVPTGLNKQQRQHWMAMVAAGDWDTVILPQTVFERVEIDPVKRAEWLREQIADLDEVQANADTDDRFSVKRLEAAKKRLETQYERATKISDPGLTFEQTGIDYLFVDEAHHYKNLSRQSDLAELSCAGSQRAADLDFKLRALREQKTVSAERAGLLTSTYQPAVATFATGTPVSNTMSEMWVMQHYLRPDVLAATDAQTVTAWGQQFTKSESSLKPKMTGDGFEQVTRIGKYVNVPELMRINSAFTDTVQRDQLETALPEVVGGDRVLLRRDPSPQVEAYIGDLSDRIENLSANRDDNMLSITGDGRRVALDGRLVGLEADDDGGRSIAVVEQIMDVHHRTQHREFFTETGNVSPTTGGLQIVFLDQSTPQDDWNMYDQIRDDLVAAGMDGDKVRFIHEAETDEARDTLFNAARNGEISVLLGSTQKMGTGTNVQARAVALHHVDCPWRPADLEQREGRIIRQGNQNEQVEIYSYATDKTFDVASWDMIARKAKFIGQMERGELAGRQMEDVVAGLEFSASRAASELSGDPRIQELAELQLRIEQLDSLQHTWRAERSKNRVMLRHNDNRVEYLATNMAALENLAEQVVDTSGDRFRFQTASGQILTDRTEAGEYLAKGLRQQALRTDLVNSQQPGDMAPLGTLGNIPLSAIRQGKTVQLVVADMPSVRREWSVDKLISSVSTMGTVRTAEHLVTGLGDEHIKWQNEYNQLVETRGQLASVLDEPFEHTDELQQLQTQAQDLAAEMGLNEDDAEESEEKRKVSGQTLTEAFGDRVVETIYRDNDVVSYQRGYYRLEFLYDDQGMFQDMYGYPADEPRPDNIEQDGQKLQDFLPMKVIERDWDQLTPMQQAVLNRDKQRDEHYQYAFALQEGDRVQFVTRADPKTILEGTYRNRQFVTDSEQRFSHHDVDQSAGFVALGKTSPEAQQAEADERLARSKLRTAHQLVPGEILQEDVDGFGYAGDIVRSYHLGRGRDRTTVAVSPDTGQARVMEMQERPPYQGRHWHTRPAITLTDAEKQTVFGGQHLDTQIGQLRPGDRVVSTDIDDRAAVKEMVTVLGVSGLDRKDLTYRDSDDVVHSSTKMDTTSVRVHERSKGALTGQELLHLNGHTTRNAEVNNTDLAEDLDRGQTVFLEMDQYQPWNGAGFSGSIPATVIDIQDAETEYATDQVTLQTSAGEHVKLHGGRTDYVLVPTDHPVELGDLITTSQMHTEPDSTADHAAPAARTMTGNNTQPRVVAAKQNPEKDQQRNTTPKPELASETEWFREHVQVTHIEDNNPSPGMG